MPTELQRLRQVVDAISSFVGTVDASGRLRWVNAAGRALCDLDPHDHLPPSITDLHPAWAAWRVMSEGVAVAARDGVWRGETAVLGPREEEIPVEQTVVAHHSDEGELESLSTVMRDLREPRRLTAELREQARLLAAVGEAVIATDFEGHVEYWNRAAERLYGWTAGEAIGRDIAELTSSEPEQARPEDVMTALCRGETWSGLFRVRNRHGREFPAWVTDTPVFDERGELARVIGVSTDISELQDARQRAQWRADQQTAVARLGQQMLDADRLDEVLELVSETLATSLDADRCEVFLLDADEARLRLRAGRGCSPDEVGALTLPTSPDSLVGVALQSGEPVVVDDFAVEARVDVPERLAADGLASALTVAVRQHGRASGALGVYSRQAHTYPPQDAAFLQSVANLLASAVEQHEAAAELEQLALYDPLTGLGNRTLATQRLARALARAGDGRRVGVVALDLDGFKLVNAGLDHARGDRLLQLAAQRLATAAGGDEAVARLGGDEFVVLGEELPSDESAATARSRELAASAGDALAGHYDLAPGLVYVTASAGVAVSHGGQEAGDLLRDAQAALSAAKRQGQGAIRLYDQRLRVEAAERLRVATALRDALARDELFLMYQPELDLRTGALFGVEALLRWRHPHSGVLTPADFLMVAEATGLIGAIGDLALQRACEEVGVRLPPAGSAPPQLAVNVSAQQLADEGLVDTVEKALQHTGLMPRQLMVEITETALVENPQTAARTLGRLRNRGVGVAVDDFGTGYSSLTHLADFPIDVVKIDRSFVSGLPAPGRHRQIVEAVVQLAGTMGLVCVAEGVETAAQLADLRTLGCQVGQGFFWSPPTPARELGRWLEM